MKVSKECTKISICWSNSWCSTGKPIDPGDRGHGGLKSSRYKILRVANG